VPALNVVYARAAKSGSYTVLACQASRFHSYSNLGDDTHVVIILCTQRPFSLLRKIMSIDIGWDGIASGADGAALGEKIRAFIHDKFQQIELPRFINAVHVHSFDLGSTSPEIEIKDICDPLPDFYEDEDDQNGSAGSDDEEHASEPALYSAEDEKARAVTPPRQSQLISQLTNMATRANIERFNGLESTKGGSGQNSDPLSAQFPRSTTPGIPGGTSNLSYFHLPGGGLSGTQTPLAAVASGTPFSPRPWSFDQKPDYFHHQDQIFHLPDQTRQSRHATSSHDDPATRPSTAHSIISRRELESDFMPMPPLDTRHSSSNHNEADLVRDRTAEDLSSKVDSRQPSDLQVVARVTYAGDLRMTLTAEILLDYPMPSFVNIPLKLAITGLTFDGVAIVASVKRKMHFCFLDPEDAAALVGDRIADDRPEGKGRRDGPSPGSSGPLRDIHIESEIGRQQDGKQVLKNVGKVESFVLEQVRRIFEEEFVFPSFWTFLV
jgi:mitochondrial distribution and morphology protein 12